MPPAVLRFVTGLAPSIFKVVEAGISTETWQAFAANATDDPPRVVLEAALTMAVTLALKLLCNMLDAATSAQQLPLLNQFIKLLDNRTITRLLAPQRQPAVPKQVLHQTHVPDLSIVLRLPRCEADFLWCTDAALWRTPSHG